MKKSNVHNVKDLRNLPDINIDSLAVYIYLWSIGMKQADEEEVVKKLKENGETLNNICAAIAILEAEGFIKILKR
jgi:hypothetical protein